MKDQEIYLYYLASDGLITTCRHFHIDYYTLLPILDKYNVYHGNRKSYNEKEKNLCLQVFTQTGDYLECAKAIGRRVDIVKKIVAENTYDNSYIASFKKSDEITYTPYFEKSKNKDYFKKESHNMAWILGFLASDGSVGLKDNHIHIGLSAKDREILEKIKQEINIENKISEYTTQDGFDCLSFAWTCAEHKQDLAKYGIIPQKTFSLKPPLVLSKQYWIDYIRGYFDGDGSINLINNQGEKSIRWQICSATPEILQWIVDFLHEEYQIAPVNIQKKKCVHDIYYIQYSTTATIKIYDILYTENALYLARKKKKFEEIIAPWKYFNDIKMQETTIPLNKE